MQHDARSLTGPTGNANQSAVFSGRFPPLSSFGRITLGTVQIGLPYGIGAAAGGMQLAAAMAILDRAAALGIGTLDTARAYGDAERRIGQWLAGRSAIPRPVIVSKFPALAHGDPVTTLRRALDESKAALGLRKIDLYLAHRHGDLLLPGVAAALRKMTDAGEIGGFGASIYLPEDGQRVLAVEGLAALQLPYSLANTALADSGLIVRARDAGIAVFARSVFLQGLLVADRARVPDRLAAAGPVLAHLAALAARSGSTLTAIALSAALSIEGITSIVLGADDAEQISDAVAQARTAPIDLGIIAEARAIASELPETLRDPRLWSR